MPTTAEVIYHDCCQNAVSRSDPLQGSNKDCGGYMVTIAKMPFLGRTLCRDPTKIAEVIW